MHIFKDFYKKFIYFFEDLDSQYKANDHFISGILQNLECQIFLPGSLIVPYGERFRHLFFINYGGVKIYDKYRNYLM